jgi:hypothetical protein
MQIEGRREASPPGQSADGNDLACQQSTLESNLQSEI